jgi:hypothetical protein
MKTSFVGWSFNQGTTCLKNENSKFKTIERIYLEVKAPIWGITHDCCEP